MLALIVLTNIVIIQRFWPFRVFVRPWKRMNPGVFLHFCLFALSWLRTFSLSFLCACRQNVAVHENCIRPYTSKVNSVYALVCRFFNAHTDESALVQKRCENHNSLRDQAKLPYIIERFSSAIASKCLIWARTQMRLRVTRRR